MILEEVLRRDKEIDWELFLSRHRELPPLYANLISTSQYPKDHLRKSIGVDFEFRYFKRLGNEWFWSSKECLRLKYLFQKEQAKNPLYFKKIIDRVEVHCNQLLYLCRKLEQHNSGEESNDKLIKEFQNYWHQLQKAASFMVVKHILNQVLEENIKQKLEKVLIRVGERSRLLKHFEILLTPTRDTLIGRANKELMDLAFKKVLDDKEIEDWFSKYDWIETLCWAGKLLKKSDVRAKLRKIRKTMKKREELNYSQRESEKLKRKLGIRETLSQEIQTLQKLLYVHTFEIECLFAARYICRSFLDEIARRLGLTFNEYPYVVYSELIAGLRGKKIDKKVILKRKGNNYALPRFGHVLTIWQGIQVKQFLANKKKQRISYTTTVNGKPAFLGKAIGKVKVITSVNEFSKFNKGDILITPMTTIDFTPYLYKAKAIVTDEGGITCHAAIVSRELGIPCVIGTKIATKVLKDGDLVEVNANEGIVKILKRQGRK